MAILRGPIAPAAQTFTPERFNIIQQWLLRHYPFTIFFYHLFARAMFSNYKWIPIWCGPTDINIIFRFLAMNNCCFHFILVALEMALHICTNELHHESCPMIMSQRRFRALSSIYTLDNKPKIYHQADMISAIDSLTPMGP